MNTNHIKTWSQRNAAYVIALNELIAKVATVKSDSGLFDLWAKRHGILGGNADVCELLDKFDRAHGQKYRSMSEARDQALVAGHGYGKSKLFKS